jgi:hypothetical protein
MWADWSAFDVPWNVNPVRWDHVRGFNRAHAVMVLDYRDYLALKRAAKGGKRE